MTPMTQPDAQAMALAKVDEAIEKAQGFLYLVEGEWLSQSELDEANQHLRFLRALRKAVERHGNEGGHGFCASCYYPFSGDIVKFPCPELTEIAKEMGL